MCVWADPLGCGFHAAPLPSTPLPTTTQRNTQHPPPGLTLEASVSYLIPTSPWDPDDSMHYACPSIVGTASLHDSSNFLSSTLIVAR